MPVEDQNYSPMTDFNHSLATLAGLPPQLPGDSKRQAVASFYGDHYQAWWSIDAWLRLPDANEVIYLEGAEDYDQVRPQAATMVQVRAHKDPISLNNAKAHEALRNFWSVSTKEANRQVDFHYLTTSPINQERGDPFDGIPGIEVWRAAQTSRDLAAKVATYLVDKLKATDPLQLFLKTAAAEEIQACLICRFHWLTDQPDLDTVKRSVDDRIVTLLGQMNQPVSLSETVREKLWSKFWDIFLQPDPKHRCLGRAELLRQVSSATTTLVPVPTDRLHSFLPSPTPGLTLFNALLETPPVPPEPLLSRDQLTQQVVQLLEQREPVLLTGTVHKGKTTSAQLVIHSLCPQAWWLGLSGRSATQSADIISVLA